MIAYISGTVVNRTEDAIIIDNQGIGYYIYYGRPETVALDTQMIVHTYQHVREDAIILFGFESRQDLAVFTQLISVKGVGPKTGLAILSKVSPQDLILAVDQEDLKFLKTLPGVGPKMASQILLDLKGKFVSTGSDVPKTEKISTNIDEAMDALMTLGFKRAEVGSIKNELTLHEQQDVNALIKYGLQLMNARRRG